MKGTLWTVVIVVILTGVIFVGVSGQYDDALQTQEIVAEEHTLSDTEPVTLEAADEWSNMIENSEVVRTTEEDELVRDEDYTIDYETGEITAQPEYDNESVEIDYQYQVVDDDTEAIAAVLAPIGQLLPWLVLMAGVGTLLGWIAKLPSGGGSW